MPFLLFTDHWARGLCRTYPQSAFDGWNGACGGGAEEAILSHAFEVPNVGFANLVCAE